jgi:signal transduction histidine kinase
MTRFNEAIDQAVAESVDFFGREAERLRSVFLGVLGHDLRGPLNAILLTSQLLAKRNAGTPDGKFTATLLNGGERMRQLLDDLLEYNRASLGIGIRVTPALCDLAQVCEEEVELQRAIWPGNALEFITDGAVSGYWDAARLKQVIGNLVANAAKYGDRGAPITVRLSGSGDEAVMTVENTGPEIKPNEVNALFDPLQRAAHGDGETERTSLGLGLFIVRHIVLAHGGVISLSSTGGKTVFRVAVPREGAVAERPSHHDLRAKP